MLHILSVGVPHTRRGFMRARLGARGGHIQSSVAHSTLDNFEDARAAPTSSGIVTAVIAVAITAAIAATVLFGIRQCVSRESDCVFSGESDCVFPHSGQSETVRSIEINPRPDRTFSGNDRAFPE